MGTLPGQVASATSFKHSQKALEFDEVLSDEARARVSLQRHGSEVQHTVTLALQQLIQLLFQKNLTHTHTQIKTHLFLNLKHNIADLMICTCVQISGNAHLTDTQLIRVGLDRTEFLEHGNAVFPVCRWSILQAEQGFIPASTCDSSI